MEDQLQGVLYQIFQFYNSRLEATHFEEFLVTQKWGLRQKLQISDIFCVANVDVIVKEILVQD